MKFSGNILITDFFTEIIQSLKHHKIRNILTGFGVAWGIFILIILLGAGQGMQNGIMKLFSSLAQNSVWIYGGQISETKQNRKIGEKITFNGELLQNIKKQFYQIKKITPVIRYNGNPYVNFKYNHQTGNIKGVGLDYFTIKLLKVTEGRTFNKNDFHKQRPVCIISNNLATIFRKKSSLIGEVINVSGSWFKVIGILKKGDISFSERNAVYIPVPAFNNSFGDNNEFNQFGILLYNDVNSKLFEIKLRQFLAQNLNFNIKDLKSVFIINQNEQIKQINMVFTAVKAFLWFVGISMLLTGIIGVGNIMLVVVKERTKEIGIRKAIGAESKSVLIMIVTESVIITLVSGIVGMISGIIVIETANNIISKSINYKDALINSFGINIPIISAALLLLIISGAFAGIIPAKKAAKVMPVTALNDE